MNGILVIDKPQGLTSHDVVAVARRCTGESHIGHTGTLDPLATGVLPLACGHATRLMRFLSASDKDYVAGVRFGFTTDSYDVAGAETSRTDAVPTRDAIDRALVSLRGEYLQTPPPFSAKKIDGQRAYARARRREEVTLTPVQVRVARVELLAFEGAAARIAITCSAGFYVRALAQTLGEIVGTGACLESLRRTRSGEFALADAITIDRLQSAEREWTAHVMPLDRLLPGLPATTVTDEGRRRVSHGQDVLEAHMVRNAGGNGPDGRAQDWVRLFDTEGRLLGLGTSGAGDGSLHPAVVLI